MKKIVSLLTVLVLALSLTACSAKSVGASMELKGYDVNGSALPDAEYDYATSDDGAWNGGAQTGSTADKSLAERGVKMVYSASIEMQTLEFDRAVQDIAALVESVGGYFEQKNFSNYSRGYRHASYTVRVPAETFTDFCEQVGTLCHVTWQTDTAENISEQYYTTRSRASKRRRSSGSACRSCFKRQRAWRISSPSSPPSRRRSMRSRACPARCGITTRWWTMRLSTLK